MPVELGRKSAPSEAAWANAGLPPDASRNPQEFLDKFLGHSEETAHFIRNRYRGLLVGVAVVVPSVAELESPRTDQAKFVATFGDHDRPAAIAVVYPDQQRIRFSEYQWRDHELARWQSFKAINGDLDAYPPGTLCVASTINRGTFGNNPVTAITHRYLTCSAQDTNIQTPIALTELLKLASGTDLRFAGNTSVEVIISRPDTTHPLILQVDGEVAATREAFRLPATVPEVITFSLSNAIMQVRITHSEVLIKCGILEKRLPIVEGIKFFDPNPNRPQNSI